jgi:hypothetical protein
MLAPARRCGGLSDARNAGREWQQSDVQYNEYPWLDAVNQATTTRILRYSIAVMKGKTVPLMV